jgi:hypothetical protein
MLPAEWVAMGGQLCSNCSTCIATELCFFSVSLHVSRIDAPFQVPMWKHTLIPLTQPLTPIGKIECPFSLYLLLTFVR